MLPDPNASLVLIPQAPVLLSVWLGVQGEEEKLFPRPLSPSLLLGLRLSLRVGLYCFLPAEGLLRCLAS